MIDRATSLTQYLRTVPPFKWGTADCGTFTGEWVHECTGENPLHGIDYINEFGAARFVNSAGGGHALVSRSLGETIAPLHARVGDIAMLSERGFFRLGIVIDGGRAVFKSPNGLHVEPLTPNHVCWRVP